MHSRIEGRSSTDARLRERAIRVIPNGMYGHNSVANMYFPDNFPQFMESGQGALVRGRGRP